MARMYWVGFSFLGLALVGCVPQEKYNAARLSLEAANERFATADSQSKAATAEADAYKRQLESIMANSNNQGGLVINLQTQVADLQSRYSSLEQQYQDAMNKQGVVQVLPEAVSNALTEFANQNPDLVEFNSARGIVKFKSDVTFTVGSAELRPEAKTAIARFAQILNSPAAAAYELQVAGHTDSQPVSNPNTKKAGHQDNWYLSSHRAISVGKEMQSQRINPQRIAVVGYADQHPVANNATEAGRAQNRRVEVLILPSAARTPAAMAEAAPTPAPAVPAAAAAARPPAAQLNKDTASTASDRQPAINK